MLKTLAKEVCPPVVWRVARLARAAVQERRRAGGGAVASGHAPDQQELDIYFTKEMADLLETWGEDNTWREIQLMLADRGGPILDVACGTGKVMELLGRHELEVHGIDISDVLLARATARGIAKARLTQGDATHMPYAEGAFTHAYSIGSLEHFTEEGALACFTECRRVAKGTTFHMIPISRSGRDEGWIRRGQSYHNNSIDWWFRLVRRVYPRAIALPSSWMDDISVGTWLVCRV